MGNHEQDNAREAAGTSGQQQQFQASRPGQMGGAPEAGGAGGIGLRIREHMKVIGADGTHVGTIDEVEGHRIKLTRQDSGAGIEGGTHSGHHHYISLGLVASVEGDTVRLSANGDVAYGLEEEK